MTPDERRLFIPCEGPRASLQIVVDRSTLNNNAEWHTGIDENLLPFGFGLPPGDMVFIPLLEEEGFFTSNPL